MIIFVEKHFMPSIKFNILEKHFNFVKYNFTENIFFVKLLLYHCKKRRKMIYYVDKNLNGF